VRQEDLISSYLLILSMYFLANWTQKLNDLQVLRTLFFKIQDLIVISRWYIIFPKIGTITIKINQTGAINFSSIIWSQSKPTEIKTLDNNHTILPCIIIGSHNRIQSINVSFNVLRLTVVKQSFTQIVLSEANGYYSRSVSRVSYN
jgi:hypothetical protein